VLRITWDLERSAYKWQITLLEAAVDEDYLFIILGNPSLTKKEKTFIALYNSSSTTGWKIFDDMVDALPFIYWIPLRVHRQNAFIFSSLYFKGSWLVLNFRYWILSTAFTEESCLLKACLPSSMLDLEKGNEVWTSILQSILQTVSDL